MKTRTKISYVILKYDDQTDNIYTKTSNNENHVYEIPTVEYNPKQDAGFEDVKTYLANGGLTSTTYFDENNIFVPIVNVTYEVGVCFYDYVAIIFESAQKGFEGMNYESWYRIKYDRDTQTWNLLWNSGLTDPIDYIFKNTSLTEYVPNPKGRDKLTFNNVMHFVTEQTNDFPILGLLSGDKFTMKQVFHYQDLLGFETLKAGDNRTFENQYADSIQTVEDDKHTTSYKIKNEYLKK
ncbi:hypothetical protein [Companilactobacillus muriivasis]|uniref:hypothetical protein n=1 Tax=Companilactobacillus muriivasis TaxID=3081444 RepID=UPI0030C67BDE